MCKNIVGIVCTIYFLFIFETSQQGHSRHLDISDVLNDDSKFTCGDVSQPPEVLIFGTESTGDGKLNSGQQFILQCIAAYPVYWDYIPSATAHHELNGKVSTNSDTEFCYKEHLQLFDIDSYSWGASVGFGRSGNYTCRSSVDATVSSSLFIYSKDNGRIFSCPVLVTTHSRVVNGTEWVIPCPANLKDQYLNVTLSKTDHVDVNGSISASHMFPGDSSVRYDSRYGFLLKKSNHDRPTGSYACEVATLSTVFDGVSSHEKVDVKLQAYNVVPSKGYVTYTTGNEIIVTCEYDEEVYINAEGGFMLHSKGSRQKQSSSFSFSITHTFEETADPATDGRDGEISCRVKSSGTVLHTWKHDVRKKCIANAEVDAQNRYWYYHDGRYVSFSNPFKYRMRILTTTCSTKSNFQLNFRYFEQLHQQNMEVHSVTMGSTKVYVSGASKIIECEMDTNYTTMFFAGRAIKEINLNANNVSSGARMNVTKSGNMQDFFIGDEIPMLCEVSKYYFYKLGILWKFIYKNGSEALIKGNYSTETNSWRDYNSASKIMMNLVVKDPEIVGVSCSANVWNSTSWETAKTTLNIKIREIWDESAANKCAGGMTQPIIVLKRDGWYYDYSTYDYYYYKFASHVVTDYDFVTKRVDFQLTCVAKYPIKLTYEGAERYYYSRDRGNKGSTTLVNDTLHHCFQTSIYGSVYGSSNTGEYLCQKLTDPNVKSYFYVYADMSPDSPLVDEGEHRVVTVDPKAETFYIPCRVTNPTAQLDLYYHENHGMYKKLNASSYLSYNPKKGFLMETKSVNFSSIYICSSQTNGNGTDALSFTFWKNETNAFNAAESKGGTADNSIFSLLKTNFTFLFLFVICGVGLQLFFLRKQFVLDGALRRIFGSYIQMEPELTRSELRGGTNSNDNGTAELIPSVF